LFVSSTGRVGIGAVSTDFPFSVSNTASDSSIGIAASNAANSEVFFGDTDSLYSGRIRYAHTGDSLQFWTASTERLRITSDGKLGLGTSTPSAKLDLSGGYYRGVNGSSATLLGDGASLVSGASASSSALRFDGDSLLFSYSNNARMTLTSGGSLGIGTTTVDALLEVYSQTNGANVAKFSDAFNNRCLIVKGASGGVNLISAEEANEASTIYGISFSRGATEMGRFDGSGRLLVGTSSAFNVKAGNGSNYTLDGIVAANYCKQVIHGHTVTLADRCPGLYLGREKGALGGFATVASGDAVGEIVFYGANGTNYQTNAALIKAEVDSGTVSSTSMPGRLVFSTTADGASSPTEVLRLTNARYTVATGSTYVFYALSNNTSSSAIALFTGRHTATNGDPGSGTEAIRIYTNGDIKNINGTYTSLSDARLKENIVDAASQWSDIKELRIRNFNFRADTGHQTHTQLGLIAQEAELVCPGLVKDHPVEDGEVVADADGNTLSSTKSVNISVLYMKAVKALQEAMERIETLEAKVAALEGA
jgi:hypothetical protein